MGRSIVAIVGLLLLLTAACATDGGEQVRAVPFGGTTTTSAGSAAPGPSTADPEAGTEVGPSRPPTTAPTRQPNTATRSGTLTITTPESQSGYRPDSPLEVAGTGCPSETEVFVFHNDRLVGHGLSSSDGTWRVVVAIRSRPPGTHREVETEEALAVECTDMRDAVVVVPDP